MTYTDSQSISIRTTSTYQYHEFKPCDIPRPASNVKQPLVIGPVHRWQLNITKIILTKVTYKVIANNWVPKLDNFLIVLTWAASTTAASRLWSWRQKKKTFDVKDHGI